MATTAAAEALAMTSMPEIKTQMGCFEADVIFAARTSELLAAKYELVLEPVCCVILAGTLPKAVVMVTLP